MKKVKKIVWQKDNLKHIADHGLSVTFADTQKTEFLRSLVGRDGKMEIVAGKSSITLETVGRVTRVHFYGAISNGFHHYSVHYYSPAEELTFTEKEEQNRHVAESAVFGGYWTSERHWHSPSTATPSILRAHNGAEMDRLRLWSGKNAWAIMGENGMRAKAIETRVQRVKSDVSSAENHVAYLTGQLERAKTLDFSKSIEMARSNCDYRLTNLPNAREKLETQLAQARDLLNDEKRVADYLTRPVTSYYYNTSDGAKLLHNFNVATRTYARGEHRLICPHFPATGATYSVPFIRANYTVARGENGSLRLSSGIVCPFDESQALAWLRGESPSLRTNYGPLAKVETCREDGTPVVLVKCGCHYIDAARDLGWDYVTLLAPRHESRLTAGTPELALTLETRAEFLARVETVAAEKLRALETRRETALRDYLAEKHKLETQRSQLPAWIEATEKEIETANATLAQARERLAGVETLFNGATLERLNGFAKNVLSTFAQSKL